MNRMMARIPPPWRLVDLGERWEERQGPSVLLPNGVARLRVRQLGRVGHVVHSRFPLLLRGRVMSETRLQIVYEGEAVASHSMDVRQLGPALMAVGELFSEANNFLNEGRSQVSVRVRSDFEHGCFLANLEVITSLIDAFKDLLSEGEKLSAREIAELLGLATVTGLLTLLGYLKVKGKRNLESVSREDERGQVKVTFEGDHNQVTIQNNVFKLSNNPKILEAVEQIAESTQPEGIDSIEFREDDKLANAITKPEGREIIEGIRNTRLQEQLPEPPSAQVIEAHLMVYEPRLDTDAQYWRFWYGDQSIRVDVSETQIPGEVMARGRVNVGDTWKVRLEIAQRQTTTGRMRNDYKILEVVEFFPGGHQQSLLPPPK